MKALVERLCADECAGRAPGTDGGRLARRIVLEALREAGLDPHEQPVPGCRGANVLASIPGEIDRWVLMAAHYDHLGVLDGAVYRGADDNAAAVAILVEVARRLAADRPRGRGVIVAAFDAEEPPYFLTEAMGSEHFARHPLVPLEAIDTMVCMDLVGHAVGAEGLPGEVRDTVFALGAERSRGTTELVRGIATAEPGVVIRPADADVIPPLSDYAAFWDRRRPFLFLTNGRSRVYHTPQDVPALLAWDKMEATARWLERFVRESCARDGGPVAFTGARSDVLTLDSLAELLGALAPRSPEAERGLAMTEALRGKVRADGTLPPAQQAQLAAVVAGLESGLA
ncbi:MAG TPA: M28 family peptidase [Sandaracinaceae bacterium LLY-WYZ-13_1]|nr:M28 family peptidase [Sandaracinaceae bacterium LLY-WYZ-13_1]